MDFSYQLYSARNEKSLDDTLKTLKQLGYTQVEGWGGQFADPAALATSLRNAGLVMPTAHMGLAQLLDTSNALQAVETVGIQTIYCPAINKEDRSTESAKWLQLGKTLETIHSAFAKAGRGFGWHNHNFEFVRTDDGKFPMDLILEGGPNMEWEMDLAWLVKGGQDPVAWLDKYGSRITAVHVKDIAPAGQALDEDGWADVGYGTLDWKGLLQIIKQKTRARYLVAEHDKPNDAIRFARRSMDTIKKWM